MKVKAKLKQHIVKYIESLKYDETDSIAEVDIEEKFLVKLILDALHDDSYFVYQEGSTKFNDNLYLVKREDVTSFFDNRHIIYAIDSMDYLRVGEYSGHNGEEEVTGIDIDTSGKFNPIVDQIRKRL